MQAATLGAGVAVRESTLGKGSGLGLFAEWAFRSSDVVTEYAGKRISTAEAKARSRQTHLKRLHHNVIINGMLEPVKGLGGWQLCQPLIPPQRTLLRRAQRCVAQGHKADQAWRGDLRVIRHAWLQGMARSHG